MTASRLPNRWRSQLKYAAGIAPIVLVWGILVFWLSILINDRGTVSERADEATLREWLDEARNFRKTLPELIREYLRIRDEDGPGTERLAFKADEIEEHIRSLTEPLRTYQNQLPMFPEVYAVDVRFDPDSPDSTVIRWESPMPRPRPTGQQQIRRLVYSPLGPMDRQAQVACEYHVHALNKLQQLELENQRRAILSGVLLLTATFLAALFVIRFLLREQRSERRRLEALAAAEHRERELSEARLRHEAAEREKERLDRELELKNAAAERMALEARSQVFAGIGIMAGSYAHNIKNLLVRPNDLLARCIEANGLSLDQQSMLAEVRGTLGTVTERLQQILATVRRDPTTSDPAPVNLAAIIRNAQSTWAEIARDKWKLQLTIELAEDPLTVLGDPSHLVQAIENLIFNARDATFEMRNTLREEARSAPGETRKQKLLDAAGWKGAVVLRGIRRGDRIVLEVQDNGIGMTDDVRENCLKTHFSTKRDNALYEGHAAGMGLGLSFVAAVVDHHRAILEIETAPRSGSTFRILFPVHAG